jgi:nucleoside-diphosphate-sugar epimerase
MRIFLAGATGVMGRRLLPLLAAGGHEVVALARGEAGRALVRGTGAEPVAVDLFDPAALREAVAGCDAVVNMATRIPVGPQAALRGAWRENDRIRSEGSRNLVDAALAAGATRYVQESIVFPYRDQGAAWITEDAPVELEFQLFSAIEAEAQAARFTAQSGERGTGVALRFGMFLDEDSGHTRDAVKMLRRRQSPLFGALDAYAASVMVRDAARAVVAALDAPAGLYNVVDDEPLTRRDHLAAAAAAFGLATPRPLPEAIGKLPRVRVLARSQRVSNAKFKEATGWAPEYHSAREGWAAVASRMAEVRSA